MLSVGQVLQDRYRVDGVLGMGGMGGVYLAHHLLLDSDVAIKEVSFEQVAPSAREAALKLFRTEAQILHRLQHANLPRFYDFFEFEGQPYMVMERLFGNTLDKVLMERLWPEEQVMEWARQLCNVLSYLHGQAPPVIFRDLKPANVIITPEGAVKLIDFGISKTIEMDGGTATMARGVGSRGFAPLEQYGGGTDERTDIYALGATLFNVATQRIPPESTQLAVGAVALPNVRDLRPEISGRLSYAIHSMMKLRSEDRPATIRQVQTLLAGHEVSESPASLFRPRKSIPSVPLHPTGAARPADAPPPWMSAPPAAPSAPSPFSAVPPEAPRSPAGSSPAHPPAPTQSPAVPPSPAPSSVNPPGTLPLPAGPPPAVAATASLPGAGVAPSAAPVPASAPLHQQPTQALGGPSFPPAVFPVSGAAQPVPAGPAPGPVPGGLPDWRTLSAPAPTWRPASAPAAPVRKVPLTPGTIVAGIVILVAMIGAGYSLMPSSRSADTLSTAKLIVTTNPAGARVKVDQVDRGVSPATVDNLRQGSTALVSIELDGYETSGKAVRLEQIENKMEVALKALPYRARLFVTPANAKVLVDGKPLAERADHVDLPPGRHTLEFGLVGYQSETCTVEASDGRRDDIKVALKPHMALLKLDGLAGVDVKVDGASWGNAASRQRQVQVGRHSLEANTALGLRRVTVEVKNKPTNAFALETTIFVERQLMARAPRTGNVMLVTAEGDRDNPAQTWQFTSADSTFSMSSYSSRYVTIEVEGPDGASSRLALMAPSPDTGLQLGRVYASANQGSRYAQMRFIGTGSAARSRYSYYTGTGMGCFTIHKATVDARGGGFLTLEATFADFDRMGRGQHFGYVRCARPQGR